MHMVHTFLGKRDLYPHPSCTFPLSTRASPHCHGVLQHSCIFAQKPYSSAKEPNTSTKELHISAKEPYICTQRPYSSAKEPYTSTKEPHPSGHEPYICTQRTLRTHRHQSPRCTYMCFAFIFWRVCLSHQWKANAMLHSLWHISLKLQHPRNPPNQETLIPRHKCKWNHIRILNLYREILRNLNFSIWWFLGM